MTSPTHREKKEGKKHNRQWFKNRLGKKIYCTDHDKGNLDWIECEGIILNHENGIEFLLERQKAGIIFS